MLLIYPLSYILKILSGKKCSKSKEKLQREPNSLTPGCIILSIVIVVSLSSNLKHPCARASLILANIFNA